MSQKEKAIDYFLLNPTATNAEVSLHTGVSKSSVQRYLSDPEVGNIMIPGLNRTIAEQIELNIKAARQKGGRNTFRKYKVKKGENGKFVGLVEEDKLVDKEFIKRSDIINIVVWFSKNPYYTIDQLASSLEGKYTSDYVYRCLNDPRVGEIFGNLIANSITQQLDNNRYGILRKYQTSWGMGLFENAGLTEREIEILNYRFSSDGIHSAEATARMFGVSKTTITKLEDAALKKIQSYEESIAQK